MISNSQQLSGWLAIGALSITLLFSLFAGLSRSDVQLSDADKLTKIYGMYANYKQKSFSKVMDISPQEAMALANQGQVVFVDVRKPPEIKIAKLPGAISQLEFLDDPSRYTGKTIVGYCTISFRSGQLAKELARQGIAMINLRGGILAWAHAGGKVYNHNGEETHRLHVYSKRWDLAPEGYTTIKFRWWDKLF